MREVFERILQIHIPRFVTVNPVTLISNAHIPRRTLHLNAAVGLGSTSPCCAIRCATVLANFGNGDKLHEFISARRLGVRRKGCTETVSVRTLASRKRSTVTASRG